MKLREQTQMPTASEPCVPNPTRNNAVELSDAELQTVSGGLNPQPLPPRYNKFD